MARLLPPAPVAAAQPKCCGGRRKWLALAHAPLELVDNGRTNATSFGSFGFRVKCIASGPRPRFAPVVRKCVLNDAFEPPPQARTVYQSTTAYTREQAFMLAVHALWLGCAIRGQFVMT